MKRIHLILLFVLAVAGPSAAAQILGPGITATAGQYNNITSTVGANANRQAANQLYQQALADKQAAIAALSPALGAKALTEAQQGIQADNQSHELAQAALGGTSTGDNSGTYLASNYNAMDNSGLKGMVNTSSPLWPQVNSSLQSFGMQMSEDKSYMVTPFGTYPTNMSPADMTTQMTAIASALGFPNPGADIAKGVSAGLATANQIGQQALADAQAKAGMPSGRLPAADGSTAGKTAQLPDGSDKDKQGVKAVLNPNAFLPADEKNIDWDERARRLAANREKLGQEMGFTPIWKKDDDIFKKIHDHYESLRVQNIFIEETSSPVAAIDKISTAIPFSK